MVLALSVPVGAVFSLCTMLFYDGGNSVMRLLNHLVSGRIYIMSSYYKTQGVSLIPRAQELFYGQYYGLIDNTYMFVFLYCGAIVALFFLWCVTKTLFRLYRGGYYKELVMIAAFALLRCAGTVHHEWFYESVCAAVRNSALSGSAGEEAG